MGAVVRGVSVEEYLKNPAYQHAEFVDGEIVERNVGGKTHGRLQIKIGRKLDEYFDTHSGGWVASEVHSRLTEARFRLPDLLVVFGEELGSGVLDRAPDVAVEIRSPEDSTAALLRKAEEYMAAGTKLVWIVLPEEKSILVCVPNAPLRTAIAGETLDGGDVLPGLAIPVDELFK